MIKELINNFKNLSLKGGNILSDKSCKYDTILLICRYIYDYKVDGEEKYLNLTKENKDNVTAKIVDAFNKNISADGNGNYLSETLNFLVRLGILHKESQEKYIIINDSILQFLTTSIENAYICQYIAVYMAFKNDNLWDDYVEYTKIVFAGKTDVTYNIKCNKLIELKNKIVALSPQISNGESQWALQTTEYYVVTLGLANDEYNVSRTLTISDKKLTPKDLSANVEGTKSVGKKDNFYIQDFRLEYVKKTLENELAKNNNFENLITEKIDLTPEWFAEESKKYVDVDEKTKKLYEQFDKDFGYNALKSLNDNEILNKLFIHDKDKNNLCYVLEFSQEYGHMFGSIKGGSAKKHGLYKGKDGKWHTNSVEFFETDDEALARGKLIRDSLLRGYELINERKNDLKTSEDYANLYNDLMEATNEYIRFAVYRKYYHMLFPNLFPAWYNRAWTRGVLDVLGIKYIDEYPNRAGEIQLFINKTGVSDIVFSKIIGPLVKDKCFNGEDDDDEDMEDVNMNNKTNFNSYFSGQGINLVIYGTPGCGKSFELNKRIKNEYKISDDNIIRTTFHHDYSNVDFVGQIIPSVDSDGTATYKQNPGPFTKALCKAYQTTDKVALIIEELNRGDAASVFGDIFQLLDRFKDDDKESYHKKGVSEYAIENSFIQQYLSEKTEYLFNNIRIPSNLYILATMNTSDQNVFTLDTAFKRRWEFEKKTNDYENYDKKMFVPGMNKSWVDFVKILNTTMLELNGQINEDKQFGLYFVDKSLLCKEGEQFNEDKTKKFAYKVFEYLWDDVVRFERDSLFNSNYKTLDDLIVGYLKLAIKNEGMKVFNVNNLKEIND